MDERRARVWAEANSERFERLSQRQRDCLRLLARGYRPKDIAVLLKISVGRVYKHISHATQVLGTTNRGDAARFFAAWEAQRADDKGGEKSGAQTLPLPSPEVLTSCEAVTNDAGASIEQGAQLAEQQDPYLVKTSSWRAFVRLMPIRPGGRRQNDLRPLDTLIIIGALTVGTIVAIGSAASLLVGLDSLFHP